MPIYHGVVDTNYGRKISLDNEKGKGVKQYDASPTALAEADKMQTGKKTYVKWGKGPSGFPLIEGFTDEPPKTSGKGGFKPQPYHPQTFVSNVVGHCIEKGLILKPEDIKEWAQTAYNVITRLESPSQPTSVQSSSQENPSTTGIPPVYDEDVPF